MGTVLLKNWSVRGYKGRLPRREVSSLQRFELFFSRVGLRLTRGSYLNIDWDSLILGRVCKAPGCAPLYGSHLGTKACVHFTQAVGCTEIHLPLPSTSVLSTHKVLDPASSVRRQGTENMVAAPWQSHFSYKLMHRF